MGLQPRVIPLPLLLMLVLGQSALEPLRVRLELHPEILPLGTPLLLLPIDALGRRQ